MEYICYDCPRCCGAKRDDFSGSGFCRCPSLPSVVRAAPHFGEEPCITGTKGSGAVFFSGCNLRCIFCQNHEISRLPKGITYDADRLAGLFHFLADSDVHNINIVTGTHYTRVIASALEKAQLEIPVVWNSSGYENVEMLRMLDGLVQVYLPDLKYLDPVPAGKYSFASDYPTAAKAAIREMFRQRGKYCLDENGILKSGVLIRHLILPENIENSMSVIDYVSENFKPGDVLFSLMSQYTPMAEFNNYPELNLRIDSETNEHLYRYMLRMGITDGYWQETSSGTAALLPSFDLTGLSEA